MEINRSHWLKTMTFAKSIQLIHYVISCLDLIARELLLLSLFLVSRVIAEHFNQPLLGLLHLSKAFNIADIFHNCFIVVLFFIIYFENQSNIILKQDCPFKCGLFLLCKQFVSIISITIVWNHCCFATVLSSSGGHNHSKLIRSRDGVKLL